MKLHELGRAFWLPNGRGGASESELGRVEAVLGLCLPEEYRRAARAFERVDEERLPLGPAGLDDLAILEMRACCAIHMGGWSSATSALERYASLCEASSPLHIDPLNLHPLNLRKCAQTYPAVPADAQALLARIDAAATAPWLAEVVRASGG